MKVYTSVQTFTRFTAVAKTTAGATPYDIWLDYSAIVSVEDLGEGSRVTLANGREFILTAKPGDVFAAMIEADRELRVPCGRCDRIEYRERGE